MRSGHRHLHHRHSLHNHHSLRSLLLSGAVTLAAARRRGRGHARSGSLIRSLRTG